MSVLEDYRKLEAELDRLIAAGLDEGPAGEAVRDAMDPLWRQLTTEMRVEFPQPKQRIIGIDPGKDGALCRLLGDTWEFVDMPTFKTGVGGRRDYDEQGLVQVLKDWTRWGEGAPAVVALERQQAMPAELHGRKQGTASAFATGYGYGLLRGIIAALGLSVEIVAPATWKAKMLQDQNRDGKHASVIRALQLYPEVSDSLKRKKDHNRAEALLIAEYVRRFRLNQGDHQERKA